MKKTKFLAVDPANPASPTVAELNEGVDLTDYIVTNDYSWSSEEDATGVELPTTSVDSAVDKIAEAMRELGREVTDEDFLRAWASLADSYTATPQDELRFRLNASLIGEDPGQPVNNGPDGWRI